MRILVVYPLLLAVVVVVVDVVVVLITCGMVVSHIMF